MAEEGDPGATFYDRLSLTEEHHFDIVAVTHSQLLSCHHDLAVAAVSDEGRRAARPEDNDAVGALIDEALVMVVVNIKVAVFAALNAELLPVEGPRSFEEELVLLIHELKVGQVSLLILPAVLLRLGSLRL